ncbi:MAG: DUF1232 domain-containing protein [Planctomycetes bacterium]|nr:DUF1232 domain-containing protein [Planctomycetota bacterium]
MSEQENEDYAKEYSEESFWAKLGKYALVAGKQVVEKALILYYCLSDRDTPKWAKGVIIAALGYFILPLDAIPDFVPGVGYADDLGVLAVAFAAVLVHIKSEHREHAKEKVRQWFG